MDINGTMLWYYNICLREVWLMSHNIVPDQQNDDIDYGRFLHENAYKRSKKEILFGNVKFDIIEEKDGKLTIGEVKKTSRSKEAAKWQLMFYLQVLKNAGIHADGVLMYPEEKKREEVVLTEENEQKLEEMKNQILITAQSTSPPPPLKCRFCGKCAYREYCFA